MSTALHERTQMEPAGVPAALQARRQYVWFGCAAVALGLLSAWLSRHDMYSDGVSYLDMASAFAQRDWSALVNAYWSPLYPALLGTALALLKPTPFWEFSVAHLVNFAIFLAALASFCFLLLGLIRYQRLRGGSWVPESWVIAAGFTLFFWTTFEVIPISLVNPDLLVAAFVYLVVGIILRLALGETTWRWFALLGLALGLGYLAKSPFFPLSAMFLAAGLIAAGGWRRAWRGIALAAAVFLLVAGPYVAAISREKGRLTFGESSRLNWAWYDDGVPRYHWQGDAASGVAAHPTRKLLDDPPIYEFNGPIRGVYPLWFDPTYWNEGVRTRWAWRGVLTCLGDSLRQYWEILVLQQPAWLLAWLTLVLVARRGGTCLRDIGGQWILLVPALFAFAMYAPVHVEPRMIGAFVTLFWLGMLTSVRPAEDGAWDLRWLAAVCRAAVVYVLTTLAVAMLGEVIERGPRHLLLAADPKPHFEWGIAQGLRQAGLEAGDSIAWIRPHPFTARRTYWWARLARLRIIAETPAGQEAAFWNSSVAARSAAYEALAHAGAKAMVATSIPDGASKDGWRRVGASNYYLYLLGR